MASKRWHLYEEEYLGKPMKRIFRWSVATVVAMILLSGSCVLRDMAQTTPTPKNVFQPGEELVYNVKYGFIKLGTVVIQTGSVSRNGLVSAHMQFWTADVPFLNTRTTVTDQFDSRDLTLRTFQEHTQNGDQTFNKVSSYDPTTKTLTYSDDQVKNQVSQNIEPYDDALGILFNMRAWSGAVGHKYLFHVRGKDGERPVTVTFTNQTENQEVAALDNKE